MKPGVATTAVASATSHRADFTDLDRVGIVLHGDQTEAIADANRCSLLPVLVRDQPLVGADHVDLVRGRGAHGANLEGDFAVELVSCCAQLQTHLARLAEDLVHFAGPEYGCVTLPEAFTTGSSLMPQKKNPDALELVRGKAARVDGDLLRLLVLLKGLPAGYQKDLQED